MGLNLAALNALAKKESPTAPETKNASSAGIPDPAIQSLNQIAVHNAPSQQTQKPSATSVLESLTNLSQSAASKKEEAKAVQVDQPGGVPADSARTIKYQEVSDRIVELRDAIHSAHPKMPGLLQEIWKTTQSYPEQVTLLTEDQMEIIIAGLEKVVDTDLANITLKSATSGKKSKVAITTDSLGF